MLVELEPNRQIKRWEKQAIDGTLSDKLNPALMFSTTHSELLLQIYSGKIDVRDLIKYELKKTSNTEISNNYLILSEYLVNPYDWLFFCCKNGV